MNEIAQNLMFLRNRFSENLSHSKTCKNMFKKKDLTLNQLNFVKFQASTTDCKITYYYTYIVH